MTKTLCLLSLVPVLTSCTKGEPVEIPKVEGIAEMRVEVEGLNRAVTNWKTEENEILRFSAPREHWATILNAFRPYQRGSLGKQGYVAGLIVLTMKNGKSFRIRVLVFGDDDEMEPSLGPDGLSHIGGSKRKLYDALHAANKASE